MKSFKGRLKIRLNDAPNLNLRIPLLELLQFAKEFKRDKIENNAAVTYIWTKPGADWRFTLQNVMISDIMEVMGKSYISDKTGYDASEPKLSYNEYLKNMLPDRLDSKILRGLDDTYDAYLELHV